MQLIPDWRLAWRLFSVLAQAIALAVLGAWQFMPDDLRSAVPSWAVVTVAMVLLVLGIIGRLVAQPALQTPAPQPEEPRA